jgi:hypothetical protein
MMANTNTLSSDRLFSISVGQDDPRLNPAETDPAIPHRQKRPRSPATLSERSGRRSGLGAEARPALAACTLAAERYAPHVGLLLLIDKKSRRAEM